MHWYTWQCASRLDGAVMYLDSVGSCAESESPQDTRNPAYIRNRPKSEGRSPANMAGITTCCCARCSCARVPSLACTLQVFFDKVCILQRAAFKVVNQDASDGWRVSRVSRRVQVTHLKYDYQVQFCLSSPKLKSLKYRFSRAHLRKVFLWRVRKDLDKSGNT